MNWRIVYNVRILICNILKKISWNSFLEIWKIIAYIKLLIIKLFFKLEITNSNNINNEFMFNTMNIKYFILIFVFNYIFNLYILILWLKYFLYLFILLDIINLILINTYFLRYILIILFSNYTAVFFFINIILIFLTYFLL